MGPRISLRVAAFARSMRREPTPAERKLWRALSAKKLEGLKFRRQSVIDDVIADFHCPQAALVVEIDGGTHDVDKDTRRDCKLAAKGLLTLRFSNQQVSENLDGVLRTIAAEAFARCSRKTLPRPLPEEGGGQFPRSSPLPSSREGGSSIPLAQK